MARSVVFAALLLVSASGAAAAQDSPAVGATMGYPASIGVLWHITERVAIRPEVSLSQLSNTATATVTVIGPGGVVISSTTTTSTNDQWNVGVGASGLFYVAQWDALRTYVSPRFQYTRGSVTGMSGPTQTDFQSNQYLVSGSFGAQYALSRRFAVFGELGLGFSKSSTTSTQPGSGTSDTNAWSTRSGVGIVVYFGG
jgi:hypothetical protein